jgi:hypothetical protein
MVETKIDKIMDHALLDHETIDSLADVRFDDEWAIFRGLTSKHKKRQVPTVSDVFRQGTSPGSTPPRRTVDRMLPSPSIRDLNRQESWNDLKSSTSSTGGTQRSMPLNAMSVEDLAPHDIVDILSATLLVLQLYEINPALIVQVFSQVFLWMASEMFNRIIAQGKKYLCRSKAMQIKMNITALEDWVRTSSLPPAIFSCHFERVIQLLQVSCRLS